MDATSPLLSWLFVAASVVAEVAGTVGLRYADGFTRPLPSMSVVVLYGLAIWLMSLAIRRLEVSLTYALWAGCGTALTALVGILFFNESANTLRLLGFAFIVVGVATLNLGS
ncbi:DMT family transporter [Burkholderia territorii]|uniref:DMT family transporter n=1 Tax=Burkholderia territorii TaxID=1503055 RepID=UPI0007595F47|nr:multidrug efflux SMR transporter [Burkholderia territorii]AOI62456.1 hypothetical protein WS51_02050 [Burkholderia territorii]KVL00825.1 hypothetical protein WS94_19070 [Burkholderia territorii]KVL42583.1 hypothetical protein WS97_02245 [Burkholderia territorii]KVL48128.1 hypothetical protein WS99_20975 [Burkholderia territorii]KVQ65486.1 hypothetical protein WT22_10105 [Burkholderia territorii]